MAIHQKNEKAVRIRSPQEKMIVMKQDSKPSSIVFRLLLPLIVFSSLLICGDAFAAKTYRVSAQVFRLGELIAKPVMTVEEGETTAGTWSVPDSAQYRFVVLIRPVADDQVSISFEFTAGNIHIQPDLVVDVGKEASVTIDNIRLTLLVERQIAQENEVLSLIGTSWWVEDIVGKGVVDMSHTTIEFPEEGKIAGDTACNRYFGGVEIEGTNLTVGALAGTRKMCSAALMNQEQAFYQAMGEVVSWDAAETGLLYLRDADGVALLTASRIEQH
jgi:heat shock protein HslJ